MKYVVFILKSIGWTTVIVGGFSLFAFGVIWLMDSGTWWGIALTICIFMSPFGAFIAALRAEGKSRHG